MLGISLVMPPYTMHALYIKKKKKKKKKNYAVGLVALQHEAIPLIQVIKLYNATK